MKRSFVLSVLALTVVFCSASLAGDEGLEAKKAELKKIAKDLYNQKRLVGREAFKVERVYKDDQALMELKARLDVLKKAIDTRMGELSPSYAEAIKKFDELQANYNKVKEEVVALAKKDDPK